LLGILAAFLPLLSSGWANSELLSLQDSLGQWALPSKNYAGWRYSSLNQINTTNVQRLRLVWSFSTGVLRGHEGQPLVVGNTMYLITPFPHTVYALDPTDGSIKWRFTPEANPQAAGVACCDVVNRGVAYAEGKIFFNTLDGWVYALDASTGKVIWKVQHADPSKGETITAAPLVVKDKVIVGISGGEFGVRGRVAAYNINTGQRVWLYYNTGPDAEVGIGPRFKPYYAWLRGKDLGATTWPGDQWKLGGATVWTGWFTYDPELNLIYYGTSNPGVWNANLRRGEAAITNQTQTRWANLWSASVIARDADTGEMVWAVPMTPHDEWDYDGVSESILVDLPIGGQVRKVLVRFDRNGFSYVIDRTNGQILAAKPYATVNWASGIDLSTGLPIRNPEKGTGQGKTTKDVCPSLLGAKNWPPAAYSPRTGLFYVPTLNVCMDWTGTEVSYVAGTPYVGAVTLMRPGPGGHTGELIAWDPVRMQKVFEIRERFMNWSGVLATAGDLVFYGTLDGYFKAVDARSGQVLWQAKLGSGVIGNPITYTGPDGRQYVAVFSGIGGVPGLVVIQDAPPDDPYGVFGVVGAVGDLGRYSRQGGTLYVFAVER
jgi:PQQ-dependent dehydrogenase (methanol/ethanol family)